MTPATRESLGLRPLPPDQARRIEAQHRALCNGQAPRWPEGLEVLERLDAPPRRLSVAQTHELAQGVNALNAQRTARAEAGAGFIVALVVGVLFGLALVHFATPCAAGHLCAIPAFLFGAMQPLPPALKQGVQTPAGGQLHEAWSAGYEAAEQIHHMAGWRLGVGHGLLAGVLLGAVSMAAAITLGQMVG